MFNLIRTQFKTFIYPSGKVHQQYLNYILWSSISNIIFSIENVISTHSMLSVVGKASTELTLSVNFIGKDLIGQIGAITFMNRISKNADKNPHKFIKDSMILHQSSIFLQSCTPLLPLEFFIPTAGFSNIMINISFTGFGAINAKIISILAQENNIGEIYSKLTLINTTCSSIGMGLGLLIVGFIPDHTTRLFILPLLAIIRIASYKKSIHGIISY